MLPVSAADYALTIAVIAGLLGLDWLLLGTNCSIPSVLVVADV
jgi:hypothetical protein